MLSEKTIGFIRQILDGDSDVTQPEKEQIMKACKSRPKRNLISAKAAMEMLQVSRPTLREYVKQGKLRQINLSARKVRFDLNEIEQLASYGEVQNGIAG